MLGFRTVCALGAALVFFAGCDSATDGQPLDPSPPEVSDFSFTPARIVFDDVVENDSTVVPLTFRVRAEDDGQIDRVGYVVAGQFAGTVATGDLEPSGDGVYEGGVTFRLGRDQRGQYTILVFAIDDDGILSNEARGTFDVEGPGLGPPVVGTVEGPDTFRPPGTLRLVATVTDPDGDGNIARVELDPPAGGRLQLYDDGRTLGDDRANDGRFTAAFEVPEAMPGAQTFVFRAFDRDGLASEFVPFTVTILE